MLFSIRLGTKKGAQEVKTHEWFRGVDWNNLQNQPAPYLPYVSR